MMVVKTKRKDNDERLLLLPTKKKQREPAIISSYINRSRSNSRINNNNSKQRRIQSWTVLYFSMATAYVLLSNAVPAAAQTSCYDWVDAGEECDGTSNQKCKYGLTCVNHDLDPTSPRVCLARGSEGDICSGGVVQPFDGCLKGMYCSVDLQDSTIYRCMKEGKDGDSCTSRDGCVTGLDCNFGTSTTSGVCVRQGSVAAGGLASNQDLCQFGLLLTTSNNQPRCTRPEDVLCQQATDCTSSSTIVTSDWFCCESGHCAFTGSAGCEQRYREVFAHRRGKERNQFGNLYVYDNDLQICELQRCLYAKDDRIADSSIKYSCSAADGGPGRSLVQLLVPLVLLVIFTYRWDVIL